MPQLLPLPLQQPPVLALDPSLSSPLGSRCPVCSQPVLYQQSITVCACHHYYHQPCLRARLVNLNPGKDQLSIACSACHKLLNLVYQQKIRLSPHVTRFNAFLVLLGSVWMPFVVYATVWLSNDALKLALNLVMLVIVVNLLVYGVVNSLWVREYELLRVGATNLALVVSAFADLEKEMQEQGTHCEIVR